jgi:hypothetical protein
MRPHRKRMAEPLPDWHSEESRRIELLQWREHAEDFDALCRHAIQKIASELLERGQNLSDFASEQELRYVVRLAAESYNEKDRRLIGLEIHVTLAIRAFVATKMRDQQST